ncbi:hypothetical protein [Bradyrhizobium lablabi]|uniref:hypothetical protein n=1 Tax=Bradyrhizobium lablabi TaxID=722472 RepID=UPI001BAB3228|nr:hypothetical protein [Bradyrhizobium lablabi]MBR0695277.1 hypothetical protein [Bradyrhizobium lablabi]
MIEARDSMIWVELTNTPKKICREIALRAAEDPARTAYLTTLGDPPKPPDQIDPKRFCQENFMEVRFALIDPLIELNRLTADVQKAVASVPANAAQKTSFVGSAAPFQVGQPAENSSAIIESGPDRVRVAIPNVPLALCRLALQVGPEAFGMDAFEHPDGTAFRLAKWQSSDPVCRTLKGLLAMSRSKAVPKSG